MIVSDRLYGDVVINEAVLVDVMESRAVKRLRGISMGGVSSIVGISPATSRFEHSVGAMLLVRRLGGTVEEQLAALLHDVSHTAFSHVIDYVFDKIDDHSFHEQEKAFYVSQTDLPAIFEFHGLCLDYTLDETNFPLLEQDAPRLCADRIDYTLRDVVPLDLANSSTCQYLIDELVVIDRRIAFRSEDAARTFAELYLKCSVVNWLHPTSLAMYEICSAAVREAMSSGLLTSNSIWASDAEFWHRLSVAADHNSNILYAVETIRSKTQFERSYEPGGDIAVRAKVRWIDPDVTYIDGVFPLSKKCKVYQDSLSRFRHTYSSRMELNRVMSQ